MSARREKGLEVKKGCKGEKRFRRLGLEVAGGREEVKGWKHLVVTSLELIATGFRHFLAWLC